MAQKGLNRALAILGPLEARIMRVIWSGEVGERFVVRDIQQQMSELAYTTIMTTVVRLGQPTAMGAVTSDAMKGRRERHSRRKWSAAAIGLGVVLMGLTAFPSK